jgi:hypothetical protein
MSSESSEPLAGRLGAPAQRKASRISRHAVKSQCAREWGGWGRLSDDGPGHYNPDLSEDPWGGGVMILHGGAQPSHSARHSAGLPR